MTLIGWWRLVLLGIASGGCAPGGVGYGEGGSGAPGTGSVDLRLELPGGDTVEVIELDLDCGNLSQSYVLNVVDGIAVAAFGGLMPGPCRAAMSATTVAGIPCFSAEMFDVVPSQVANVQVTLLCKGMNDSSSELPPCYGDLIGRVYSKEPTVLIGTANRVEVELAPGAMISGATYTFFLRNRDADGMAQLHTAASCEESSAACQNLTCTGLGPSPELDPDTHLRTSEVWIAVRVEDESCFDSGETRIQCVQLAVCGDGATEGEEDCDDANDRPDDGCDACVSSSVE